MAIPPSLIASARSSYRTILRAGSKTFAGDEPVLKAWQDKARQAFTEGRSITDVRQYQERLKLANEVAQILRTNIVQAQQQASEDSWTLRMTQDTELGDNYSVKVPKPVTCGSGKNPRTKRSEEPIPSSPSSSAPRGVPSNESLFDPDLDSDVLDAYDLDNIKDDAHSDADAVLEQEAALTSGPPRMNHNRLVIAHRNRKIPELREEDLEETFIRGSGPGGQSINKTSNNVSLLHEPTGLRVVCQHTRSLQLNRRLARRLMVEKLDRQANPGLTKDQVKWSKERERKRQREKKARKKQKAKELAVAGGPKD